MNLFALFLIVNIAPSILTSCVKKPFINDEETNWWKYSIFYQIYPRSFKDNNADGIGDLQGVTEKLTYLKESGITGTWLSPIFSSPMKDFGYDISDFKDINPDYGTMQDFDAMMKEANKLRIKIVLDFVPNHSSDQHEWFQKSVNREEKYKNYYIWHPGKNDGKDPPNNWISVFKGSAWTYHPIRKEWYFHNFLKEQPDLNYRDPGLVEDMKDILRFWLRKGVAGFRVDALPHLFEAETLKDEPKSDDPNAKEDEFNYLNHIYTVNQPENFDMVKQWREVLDEHSRRTDNISRVLMTEVYADIETSIKYYKSGASFSFNFNLLSKLKADSKASDIEKIIKDWMSYMSPDLTANWVLGNHDNHRLATRLGKERISGYNMLLLILPGIAVTYNGEEIGMEDGEVTWEQHQDPATDKESFNTTCRDFERTPFHWDSTRNAGFSNASRTWLPVSEKYKEVNLELQRKQGIESQYYVYTRVAHLRRSETLMYGELIVKSLTEDSLAVVRYLQNKPTYVLVFNLGAKIEHLSLRNLHLDDNAKIYTRSVGSKYKENEQVSIDDFEAEPYGAYILKN